MSITDVDTTVDVGVAAPEAGTPEGGNPTATEPVEVAVQEPTGERYPVKIDGAETEVTLDELRSGYQRQQDYTRKTQEIAAERKRLAQAEQLAAAFDTDPQGTLKALNEAFNYQQGNQTEDADWESLTPEQQRLTQIESQLQAQQGQAARARIESEFSALETEHGADAVNRQQIAAYAMRSGMTVTDAYKLMAFDAYQAQQKQKQTSQAQLLQEKRDAQAVHTTGGAQRGAVTTATPAQPMTVRQAYELAVKQVSGS